MTFTRQADTSGMWDTGDFGQAEAAYASFLRLASEEMLSIRAPIVVKDVIQGYGEPRPCSVLVGCVHITRDSFQSFFFSASSPPKSSLLLRVLVVYNQPVGRLCIVSICRIHTAPKLYGTRRQFSCNELPCVSVVFHGMRSTTLEKSSLSRMKRTENAFSTRTGRQPKRSGCLLRHIAASRSNWESLFCLFRSCHAIETKHLLVDLQRTP